jgi:hypothetical protein
VANRKPNSLDAATRRTKAIGKSMTFRWQVRQRMNFIKEHVIQHGMINRADIMKAFEVSMPQASTDIKNFIRVNPDFLIYDLSKKTYMRKGLKP